MKTDKTARVIATVKTNAKPKAASLRALANAVQSGDREATYNAALEHLRLVNPGFETFPTQAELKTVGSKTKANRKISVVAKNR